MQELSRQFQVSYWQAGLLKVTVQAADVLDAVHILQRENIRPVQILSIREITVEDTTLSGLQRAIQV